MKVKDPFPFSLFVSFVNANRGVTSAREKGQSAPLSNIFKVTWVIKVENCPN